MSQAIQVVEVVKAIRRIPSDVAIEITYFSAKDVWEYHSVMDNRRCEICSNHEETGEFRGNLLRTVFPDLEIIDWDIIRVNTHPNCRCYLLRVTREPE